MNRVYILLLSLLALGVILPGSDARAQTIRDTTSIATGLRTPWEIIYGPDDWIWMTERRGEVSRINPVTKEIVSILSLNTETEVYEDGDAGLLGMALHPNFRDSAHVFLVYNYTTSQQLLAQKVVRYTYNGTKLVDPVVILQDIFSSRSLNSGRIIATPDRKLIYAPATAELGHLAPRFNSLNGKILRMNFDGTAPADNPFPTLAYPYNLIYTRGHRNSLGLAMGPTGLVYQSEENDWEVDPDTEDTDEINILTSGRHYGYPNIEGSPETEEQEQFVLDSSIVLPIRLFRPTPFVAGIEYYSGTGDSTTPEWANSLLVTMLKGEELRVLKLSPDGRRVDSVHILYKRTWGRLRDVAVAPDGRIFLATSNRDGFGSVRPGDDRVVMLSGRQPTSGSNALSVTVPDGVRDPGDRIEVTVVTEGTFPAGNQFIVQLSDANGSFAPKTVGSLTYPIELGKFVGQVGRASFVVIPCAVPTGSGYRIRAVTTTPPDTTADNGTDISIVATVPTFTVSGRDLTVDSTFQSYQWLRDGELIAGATSKTFTAIEDGRYSVRVRTADGCLVFSSEVAIGTIGVDETETGSSTIAITPHPVRDHAVVSLDLKTGGKMEITVRDIRGVVVSRIEDQATAGTYRREISTNGLPSGTYFITLTVGEKSWQVRMLKD